MLVRVDNIPECNKEFEYEFHNTILAYSTSERISYFVDADCWALRVKYTVYDNPIVEMNSFPLEGTQYIFNEDHPEYIETISKLKGNQFRTWLLNNTYSFFKSIDWVEIYMFGPPDTWKVRITRDNRVTQYFKQ